MSKKNNILIWIKSERIMPFGLAIRHFSSASDSSYIWFREISDKQIIREKADKYLYKLINNYE